MKRLITALLEAGFIDVTGMPEGSRIKDRKYIPLNLVDKLSMTEGENVIGVVDHYGHTWIRPNLLTAKEKTAILNLEKLLRSNRQMRQIPFQGDLHFLMAIWPHKY
ncbi:hypothetical protein ISR92_02940 [Patescibacteria group bacterium]|nr:hypothetical protein [Patescibacteria group bacterium]